MFETSRHMDMVISIKAQMEVFAQLDGACLHGTCCVIRSSCYRTQEYYVRLQTGRPSRHIYSTQWDNRTYPMSGWAILGVPLNDNHIAACSWS